MPILHRVILVTILLFTFRLLSAQQFGGNPPSIKWRQVNTPFTRVIYPVGLDSQASRVSNVISLLANTTQQTIGSSTRKINVVLQNQTTISNAYVGLGPFRSEFLLTPLQNSFELGSLPWVDQLATHEFRHVQQYNNFNIGISKVMRILFGEEGQAFANNAAIPNWFFEGDAVLNETAVSRQGRGRLPFFYNPYRSLWRANINYPWMKLRNGSYKDFVPDHYALGYLLVAYGREKYGDDFWKRVTHDAAAFKGLLYPFQHAIKKYANKSYPEFRNEALYYFKSRLIPLAADTISEIKSGSYASYEYPYYADVKTRVFVKSSYKNIPGFYMLNAKGESKIRVKDVSVDNYFSYRNGKIIYASYRPDLRWTYRDYSELQVIDVASGKQKTITKGSKYFAPDISENGKQIVAVRVGAEGNSILQVLNTQDGNVILSVDNPEHLFYTYPKFYTPDQIVSAVRNKYGQMSLALINTTTKETDYLLPFSFNVIGFPFIWQDTVYFSGSYGNDDRLFAYDIRNRKTFILQSGLPQNAVGYYHPAVNKTKITFTTFTAFGFKLIEINKDAVIWKQIEEGSFNDTPGGVGVTAIHKTNADLLSAVPRTLLPSDKYRKTAGLFNFHSIEPNINDPEYSITWVSENILNTLQSQLSFTYNRNEKFKTFGFNGVYSALFPYLTAGLNYTMDRRGRFNGERIYWDELEPGAGINIPLNLSKGRGLTYVNVGSRYTFNKTIYKGPFKDTLGIASYSYLNNFISVTNQVQRARQQIFPQFAQTLSVSYKKSVTGLKAGQIVANAGVYFPGLFTNQSIVLNGAWMKKDRFSEVSFSSGFPFSRGYTSENLYKMTRWGVNYHFPICYPDKGFANIIYLMRTRANIFYDHTSAHDFFRDGRAFQANFRSTGMELYFDTKWWNELPVNFGIRYSRLLDQDLFGGPGRNRWELILPVNLLQQ